MIEWLNIRVSLHKEKPEFDIFMAYHLSFPKGQ